MMKAPNRCSKRGAKVKVSKTEDNHYGPMVYETPNVEVPYGPLVPPGPQHG